MQQITDVTEDTFYDFILYIAQCHSSAVKLENLNALRP